MRLVKLGNEYINPEYVVRVGNDHQVPGRVKVSLSDGYGLLVDGAELDSVAAALTSDIVDKTASVTPSN